MSAHAWTEDRLVEQPAIELFGTLGWQTVSALEETFGSPSPSPPTALPPGEGRVCLGRETKGEVVLVDRLRDALTRLNPGLPAEAIQTAIDELARDRSAMSLEAINRTDTLNASGHLRRLRDLGLLEMKGAGNRTYYVPGALFAASSARDQAAGIAGNPHQPAPNTHQLSANTHQPPADPHQLLAAAPEWLRARIPDAGTKPRKGALRALILDLCAWRALSAREMAALLGGRDHKHLVREFLSPMVQEGLLAYTIPAMENHPDQRYTVPAAPPESGGTTA